MYNRGDKVLFIDGDHKDKFGMYLYHDYDSGYYPSIYIDDTPQWLLGDAG